MERTRALTMFLAVANSGSFRKAAAEAGISPQAVSKTIKLLEGELGVKLLHRTTRHLSLTEEGHELFQHANPGMQLLNEALERVESSKNEMVGKIRIAAPLAFGNRVLVSLMGEFQDLFPGVHFDLMLSDDFVDTVSLRIDAGFRAGTTPDRNVISRKLDNISSVICASPDYLKKYGRPLNLQQLSQFRCTGFIHPQTGKEIPWEIQNPDGFMYVPVPAVTRFNNIESEIEAVKQGMGIGQLSGYLIQHELASGALIPVLNEFTSSRLGIYIYYSQRTQLPLRVRKFIDFCIERICPQVNLRS